MTPSKRPILGAPTQSGAVCRQSGSKQSPSVHQDLPALGRASRGADLAGGCSASFPPRLASFAPRLWLAAAPFGFGKAELSAVLRSALHLAPSAPRFARRWSGNSRRGPLGRVSLLGLPLVVSCLGVVSVWADETLQADGEPAAGGHSSANRSLYRSKAGWLHPIPASGTPGVGDRLLYEARFFEAMAEFQGLDDPAWRLLGLGQAHLGLGRFYTDLWPLAARFAQDHLQRLAGERELSAEEKEQAAFFQCERASPARECAGAWERESPLAKLLALEDPALLSRADEGGARLFGEEMLGAGLSRVRSLPLLARLHLRLAVLRLLVFRQLAGSESSSMARVMEMVKGARRLADRQRAKTGAWRLGGEEAIARLRRMEDEKGVRDLLRLDPAWLLLKAWMNYGKGGCRGYALATMDLSALEETFPVVPEVTGLLRRIYAWDCTGGGRVAGG